MNHPDDEGEESPRTSYLSFPDQFRSLFLATVDRDGIPDASYAPFVRDENGFYILTSQLAAHTQNMEKTHRASILFAEDETVSTEIFARRRLSFRCTAERLAADAADAKGIPALFRERFGDVADLLQTLPDFRFFFLRPGRGLFVLGFGKAYLVDGSDPDVFSMANPRREERQNAAQE